MLNVAFGEVQVMTLFNRWREEIEVSRDPTGPSSVGPTRGAPRASWTGPAPETYLWVKGVEDLMRDTCFLPNKEEVQDFHRKRVTRLLCVRFV